MEGEQDPSAGKRQRHTTRPRTGHPQKTDQAQAAPGPEPAARTRHRPRFQDSTLSDFWPRTWGHFCKLNIIDIFMKILHAFLSQNTDVPKDTDVASINEVIEVR